MKMNHTMIALFTCIMLIAPVAHANVSQQQDELVRREDVEQIEQQVIALRAPALENLTTNAPRSFGTPHPLGASGSYSLYLPILFKASFISGRVTLSGAPAGGERIELRTLNGTVLTTNTDGNGNFAFANPPLTSESSYYVRYYNISPTYNGRLAVYLTRNFSFDGSGSVDLGSFDIADIALATPFEKASVTVPQQFSWSRRAATLAAVDSYVFEMRPDNTTTQLFKSDGLGYVDNYVLTARPFDTGTATQIYSWGAEVVNSGPAGNQPLGLSYYVRKVTISN